MKKDIISKESVKTIVIDIAKYILNFEIKDLEFIDKESQRVEDRRADIVAKVDNSYILHLEIQNNNDNSMHIRMLRYFTDIQLIETKYPIKQYLIYIGKENLTMKDSIKGDGWLYRYHLIDMKSIDCEKFIKIDTPDALVLAILCDFKDKDTQEVVNYIIKRIYDLTKNSIKDFRKYMLMLEELSNNRDLKENVKKGEKMLSEINYKKLPSYELGFEIGEKIGEKKGERRGEKRGEKRTKLEIAKNLLDILDTQTIAQKIGLSIEDIEELKVNLSK